MPFPLSQITPRTTGLPQARYETVASRGGGRERVVKGWGEKGNVKHQHACLDADVDEVGQRVRSPFSFFLFFLLGHGVQTMTLQVIQLSMLTDSDLVVGHSGRTLTLQVIQPGPFGMHEISRFSMGSWEKAI